MNQVEPSYSTHVTSSGWGCSNLASHGMRGEDRLWQGLPKTGPKWPQNVKTGQNWPRSAKTDPKWPQGEKVGRECFERHRQGIGRADGQTQGLEIVEAGTRCMEPSKSELIQNFILETPVLRFSRHSR